MSGVQQAMDKPSYSQWVEMAIRRRQIFLEVAGVTMAVVLAATFLWPPVYRSSAKILIQDNRAQLLVSPALDGSNSSGQPAVVTGTVTEQDLNSERELLASDYLIEQALSGLPRRSEPGWKAAFGLLHMTLNSPELVYGALHDTPAGTPLVQWAHRISRHLSASVIKRSDLIDLSFTANDPQWSRKFLKRLINKYLELHSSLSHDPQAERFFQTQAKLLEARLHGSEERLKAYELQTGISNLDEQKQAIITRISGLQDDASKDAASLAAAQKRSKLLAGLAARTPERIPDEVKVVQNMALQALKPQVLQLEAERADLLTRYQPTSERIQEINAKLAAAQKIVRREDHLQVQERSTNLNPERIQIDTNREQAEADVAALGASRTALARQIAKAQGQLDQLLADGVKVERLQRQVEADKEAYMSYLRRGEEARVAGALNSSKILNVSVAEPPSLPSAPIYPIIPLNLGVGLLLALCGGLAAAYFEEQHDARICSTAAVESASGLRTIARVQRLG